MALFVSSEWCTVIHHLATGANQRDWARINPQHAIGLVHCEQRGHVVAMVVLYNGCAGDGIGVVSGVDGAYRSRKSLHDISMAVYRKFQRVEA